MRASTANGGDYLLSNFTAVGSKLFFGADDAAHGPSLWVSDGTPSGTTFVKAFGDTAGHRSRRPRVGRPADR